MDYEDKRLIIVENRLDRKKAKIDQLERTLKILQPESIQSLADNINEFIPEVHRLSRTQRWWHIGLRILIGIVIGATFTIVYVETRAKDIIKETVYETMQTIRSGE